MRLRVTVTATAVVVILSGGALAARGSVTDATPATAGGSSIGTALVADQTSWEQSTTVDHVHVVGQGSGWSAELSFDDGSALDLDPDASGVIDATFPARTVTSATLAVAGTGVHLRSWSVERAASSAPAVTGPTTVVTASSSSSTTQIAALSDGDIAHGQTGAEWVAATTDAAPWIQWTYSSAKTVASLQVVGPSATYVDPEHRGLASMNGTLVFSDGSRVPVSGINGQMDLPTTLAFAPRSVTWVRLQLAKTIPQTMIGLREAAVFDATTAPPRWPTVTAPTYAITPPAATGCSTTSTAIGSTTDGSPALVCPATGSRVAGTATVVVQVAPGAVVTATSWVPTADGRSGTIATVATATADTSGRATLRVDTTKLPHGPFAVRITSPASKRALYSQLDNGGGIRLVQQGSAPAGMALRYDEGFTTPLSAADRRSGMEYWTKKPETWGGSEFGSAQLVNPDLTQGPLGTVDSDFLRIRLQPFSAGEKDRAGWGRTIDGGLISSLRIGGAGFSAQDGYFEARILGAPGKGTWPSFWTMSTEATTPRSTDQGEADVVELYGDDSSYTCRTTHNWSKVAGQTNGKGDCRTIPGVDDWALAWHTYGVRISAAGTDYYLDGQKVMTHAAMRQNAEPFYFMLDLAAGNGKPIDLSPTGGVSDMYVDWVHVYT